MPLGLVDLSRYHQLQLRLEPGDRVLCYTDSLHEGRGISGEMLLTQGLLEKVREIDLQDEFLFIPSLLDALRALDPANLTEDDVTVLLLGPNRFTPTPSLARRFLAPVLLVRNLVGSLLPGGSRAGWPEWSLANLGGALFGLFERSWRGPRNALAFEEDPDATTGKR